MRASTALVLLAVTVLAAGCSGSSEGPAVPTVGAARTFDLQGFAPGSSASSRTFDLSFTIRQPSGKPLTAYRRGAGPHTGVHLILVRSDLGAIAHYHPPIGADGKVEERVTVPTDGRYRLVVDAYPNLAGPLRNFQLFHWIDVGGDAPAQPTPAFKADQVVDGYRFHVLGRPALHAIQAATLSMKVTDPSGKPVQFTPWFGALAHAIFFRSGTLSYFHSHVCGANAPACASTTGPSAVTGTTSGPGRLDVGVLLPLPGTWRLFLQTKVGDKVLTAPFTLKVAP